MGECAVCGELTGHWVNGVAYCAGHMETGLRLTVRGLGIERGVEEDSIEWAEAWAVAEMRRLVKEGGYGQG